MIIGIALGILAAGTLFYFKCFVTPLDKTGMIYKNTGHAASLTNQEEEKL